MINKNEPSLTFIAENRVARFKPLVWTLDIQAQPLYITIIKKQKTKHWSVG